MARYLPEEAREGATDLCVHNMHRAPLEPDTLYMQFHGGVYRSDDAGESWQRVNTDDRQWGRDGDFNEVRADPKNPDVIYVANVVTWKSTDGGKTFGSFRGAPGGDDYHRVWINPDDPKTILIASTRERSSP